MSAHPLRSTRALQVAIVAPTFGILGGHAVLAGRLVDAWRNDSDVDAWLVPINPPPVRPLRFALRIKYVRTVVTQLTYWPLLLREIPKADVVHVFSASYSAFVLSALPAIVVARAFNRPVVLNYHSGEAADHLRRSRLARAVLRSVERIVVPSAFLADVFREHGLDAAIVPNVVDGARFAYRERDPLRPRILSTRNLTYPYNVACTLRAFRLIQDARPDATLTIVGAGGEERPLRQLAADLGLTGVEFAGRVDPDSIHRCYAEHDIYLQSPDIDNMPLSVLEAFASGLPLVSTNAGGVPTILQDGTHGLLAPVGDHQALADCVLRLLADPDRARQLASAAHLTCQRYQWPVVRMQWLDAYRGAMLARTSQAPAVNSRTS